MEEHKDSLGDLRNIVPQPYDVRKYPPDPKEITKRTSLKARKISMRTIREVGIPKPLRNKKSGSLRF